MDFYHLQANLQISMVNSLFTLHLKQEPAQLKIMKTFVQKTAKLTDCLIGYKSANKIIGKRPHRLLTQSLKDLKQFQIYLNERYIPSKNLQHILLMNLDQLKSWVDILYILYR